MVLFTHEAVPGVMFIVAQNEIQYVELSESSLAMFFSFLEDLNSVLDGTQLTDIAGLHILQICVCSWGYKYICSVCRDCLIEWHIYIYSTGVDYHFHRKELYLALSNGSILRYSNLSLDDENRELIVRVDQLPTGVYAAMQGNTLGCITVDWLFDNVYWTEIESSLTKVCLFKHILLYLLKFGTSKILACSREHFTNVLNQLSYRSTAWILRLVMWCVKWLGKVDWLTK